MVAFFQLAEVGPRMVENQEAENKGQGLPQIISQKQYFLFGSTGV
jgi:hypothetical protein